MALPQGITKEFLDMTYPDQYYKSVIEPAKLGKGPVPGKIEMLSKSQPLKAMRIGMDPYLPKSMQAGYDAVRAAPTKYASTALNWLGKGITTLASLPAQAALMTLHSTPVNADEIDGFDMKAMMAKEALFKKKQKQADVFKKIKEKQLADEAAAKAKADAAAAAKEAAQKAATKKQAAQNKKNKTGGYQSSHGGNKGFMGGKGTAAEMGSFAQGGLIDFYRYGGFI